MAEKKTKTSEESPGASSEPDKTTAEETPEGTTGAPSNTTTAEERAGAGDYVVIADQVPLKSGTGKEATYTTHKRGATVSLTETQAAKLTGGTRPVVVASSAVSDGNVRRAAHVAWKRAATARAKRRR